MAIKSLFKADKEYGTSYPTIFHVTHYKSGSQWVLAILTEVAKNRIVKPQEAAKHVTEQPIVEGMIYPCVYLPRPIFMKTDPPENRKVFIVIRDLRDTIVSLYFSVRNSHQILSPAQQSLRNALKSEDIDRGMLLLMEQRLHVSAEIQKTWLNSGNLIIRYEDLNGDEYDSFKKIVSHCNIQVDKDALLSAIAKHSFEKRAGRKRGDEDINSHHRKGIVGDWRNYFNERIKSRFKEKFGDILIATGYENSSDW